MTKKPTKILDVLEGGTSDSGLMTENEAVNCTIGTTEEVLKAAQPPEWAIDTPDPHALWPDPRPEPSSDAHDMDFGDAIRCLKRGQRMARAGWNGKGMWLVLALDGGFLPIRLTHTPTRCSTARKERGRDDKAKE